MDKRLILVLILLGASYLAPMAAQRWGAPQPRRQVARWIALLAGSKNDRVLWHILAVQIGLLTFPFWYFLVYFMTGHASLFVAGVLMLVFTAVLQLWGRYTFSAA